MESKTPPSEQQQIITLLTKQERHLNFLSTATKVFIVVFLAGIVVSIALVLIGSQG